jgi:hypothetical protein
VQGDVEIAALTKQNGVGHALSPVLLG